MKASYQQELRETLERAIGSLEGVSARPAKAGPEPSTYWVDDTEFAWTEGDDTVVVRMTKRGSRALRKAIRGDTRVARRSYDWLAVRFAHEGDAMFALQMVIMAANANRIVAVRGDIPAFGLFGARRRRRKDVDFG